MSLSFKEFIQQALDEDAASKVAQLDTMMATLDNQLQRLTQPINMKKMGLQKQKQALMPQIERERAAAEKEQQGQMVKPNTPITGTTTPGSAGAQTPGQPG